MTGTDKLIETSPNLKLSRAKQILEIQKTSPPLASSLDEENPKKPNVTRGETGGPKGPDPTRFGDWESNGRCIDF